MGSLQGGTLRAAWWRSEPCGDTLRAAWWHSQGTFSIPALCMGTALLWRGCSPAPLSANLPGPGVSSAISGLRSAPLPGAGSAPAQVALSALPSGSCRCFVLYLTHILFFFSPREQVRGINPNLHFLDDTASLSRELEALNSSLVVTNSQYQNKRTQFESSRSTDLSGTALQLQHLFICSHSFTSA